MTCNPFASISARLLFWCLTVLLATPLMAAAQGEANKALARRFYEEVWFSRNPAAVDELVTLDDCSFPNRQAQRLFSPDSDSVLRFLGT